MTVYDAIKAVLAGKRARRPCWDDDAVMSIGNTGDPLIDRLLVRSTSFRIELDLEFDREDLEAADWEIVE